MKKLLFPIRTPFFPLGVVVTLVFFSVFAKYTSTGKQSCEVAFSLKSPEQVNFSIYYNIGKGLNQKDTQTKLVEPVHQKTSVRFCIPVYSELLQIRFDPSTKPIEMEIHSISLRYSDGTQYDVPLESLQPGEQIADYAISNDILTFNTVENANDPVFMLSTLADSDHEGKQRNKFTHYALWSISAILLCFVLRMGYFYFFLGVG